MGVNTIPQYVNLLTGWGFKYKVILDDDNQGRGVYKQIVDNWSFGPEEKEQRLLKLKSGPTIEELFSSSDFQKWVLKRADHEIEHGKKVSSLVSAEGKALAAKKFYSEVEKEGVHKEDFDAHTRENFETVFKFIQTD